MCIGLTGTGSRRAGYCLPTRLNLPTVRVTTTRLNSPVVGSAWVPCNLGAPKNLLENSEKALCAFLNSSVGLLSILGDRTNKKPTYPNLSIDDLRKLPVPDFQAIGDGAIWMLAMAFDSLAEEQLRPLPEMDMCETPSFTRRIGLRGAEYRPGDSLYNPAATRSRTFDHRQAVRVSFGMSERQRSPSKQAKSNGLCSQ